MPVMPVMPRVVFCNAAQMQREEVLFEPDRKVNASCEMASVTSLNRLLSLIPAVVDFLEADNSRRCRNSTCHLPPPLVLDPSTSLLQSFLSASVRMMALMRLAARGASTRHLKSPNRGQALEATL